jgi:phosphoribosylformylglycinamidine cyclo-ligase
VRKVFSVGQQKKLAHELLKPTRIYVKPVLEIIKNVNVKGIAHITGGAFHGKLTRVLPKNMDALVDKSSWNVPNIFRLIQQKGNVEEREMFRTFNMGIGMILAVSPKDVKKTQKILAKNRLKSWVIGKIIKGNKETIIK